MDCYTLSVIIVSAKSLLPTVYRLYQQVLGSIGYCYRLYCYVPDCGLAVDQSTLGHSKPHQDKEILF